VGGAVVEVATVGAVRAICQVAGSSLRMDATAYLDEVARCEPFRALTQSYIRALFGQIS
jgi:hypothetical protein